MKLLAYDPKRGLVKVVPETSDDMWLLSLVVQPGDLVTARTVREVKFGERGSGRSSRVPMTLTVRVEGIEFQPFTSRLRIRGIVVEGPEKFGVKGKHHTLSVQPGQELVIVKEGGWPRTLLEKLRQATQGPKVEIVAVDYDEYAVGVVQGQGMRIVVEEPMGLPGKDDPRREEELRKAIAVVAKAAASVYEREKPLAIVVVGPGHLREVVAERIRSETGARVITDTASMGGSAGVMEAVRRGNVRRLAQELVAVRAEDILEEFQKLIVKDPDRVAYGLDDVWFAVEQGAVDKLLVLDELLHSYDEEVRRRVYELLRMADATRAEVHIVPSESPAGQKLRGVGGVVAILRYPLPRGSEPAESSHSR